MTTPYPYPNIHEPGQEVSAMYGIRWQVSWVGSGIRAALPDQTATSNSMFAVAEVQSVATQ